MKPDLLLPAAHGAPAREALGASLLFGLWWLVLTLRCLLVLLGGSWPGTVIAVIVSPLVWWLTILLAMSLCAWPSPLLCRFLKWNETRRRAATSVLFLIACGALAGWLVWQGVGFDRALGVLWGAALSVFLLRRAFAR